MATWGASRNWADEEEDEDKPARFMPETKSSAEGGSFDDVEERRAELPPAHETEVDPETGMKTLTEYKLNAKGQRVKVTKQIKVDSITRSVRKRVVERRTWTKFGHAADAPRVSNTYSGAGYTEEGVTYFPDVVFLDLTPKAKAVKPTVEDQGQKVGSVVVCRICGMTGDHWTLKCPNKEKIASGKMQRIGGATGATSAGTSDAPDAPSGPRKYVPPSVRNADGTRMTDISMAHTRDDTNTLRVSNLSEETRESDLSELFRAFGPIQRIYLARDHQTEMSRGFAFVTFMRREDAQSAMDRLAGYGYDHLILQIEWANR
jgi:translation initiation factor 3 subunit G